MRTNSLLAVAVALLATAPAAAAYQVETFEGIADPAINAPQELPNGGISIGDFYISNIFQSPVRPWYIVPAATTTTGPSNGTDYIQTSYVGFGSLYTGRMVLKSFDIASLDGSSFDVLFETYGYGINRDPLAITGSFQTINVKKILYNVDIKGATPSAQFAIDNIVWQALPAIPEPATWLQLGLGIGVIGAVGRLARRKAVLARAIA